MSASFLGHWHTDNRVYLPKGIVIKHDRFPSGAVSITIPLMTRLTKKAVYKSKPMIGEEEPFRFMEVYYNETKEGTQ